MGTPLPSKPGSAVEQAPADGGSRRVGHVYLDVRRRVLHCLNDTARQLHADGVPFTPADLTAGQLARATDEPVTADELPLVTAWREQRPVETDFLLPRPGGAAWYIAWNVAPTKDAHGAVVGVLGTVTCGPPDPDYRLLAELAHDLRTPLQAIGMLSAILDGAPPMDAEVHETLLRIRAAAGRALEVGRDLLDWSRNPSARGRPVTPSWFSLEPFLVKLAEEQLGEARRKRLELDVDLAASRDWEVYIDRVRLGRLLSNLLSNAIRYTTRGHVQFTAAWREGNAAGTLALGVIDTGAGIGPEEQESIFEPYERGRAGKESDSGGSGLGLASVDNLVKELGLTLEVYSEHNRGSAFHLLLPPTLLRRKSSGVAAAASS